MILEHEQELAADYFTDNAEASSVSVSATMSAIMSADTASDTSELQQQLQQGLGANQTVFDKQLTWSLELCSTLKLSDMFEGYNESDKKRLQTDFLIIQTGFHVDREGDKT